MKKALQSISKHAFIPCQYAFGLLITGIYNRTGSLGQNLRDGEEILM